MLKISAQQPNNHLKSMIYLTILDSRSKLALLGYLAKLARLGVLVNLVRLAFLALLAFLAISLQKLIKGELFYGIKE